MSKINTGYCARSSKSLGNVTSSREQLNSEEIADKFVLIIFLLSLYLKIYYYFIIYFYYFNF